MKLRLYARLFYAIGMPTALIAAVSAAATGFMISSLTEGSISVAAGVIGGLAGGFLLGLISGGLLAVSIGTLHFSKTDDSSVQHSRSFAFPGGANEAWAACAEALHAATGVQAVADSSAWRMTSITGPKWPSWGDEVTCEVHQRTPDLQVVVVGSRPRMRSAIVDYGSNIENVERVTAHLLSVGAQRRADA